MLLSACAPAGDSSGRFTAVADVQQLMASIVDPAADFYWDAVGWIVDENGTEEVRPANDEEWEAVVNAAFLIAESGNLLLMESRALDEGAWIAMSQALIDVGKRAIEAAETRNEMAVFDVGAEVYAVCTNCHAAYALGTLRPNDARTN